MNRDLINGTLMDRALMNRDLLNRNPLNGDPVARALRTTVARAFRRTALPLAAYYAITLAVPLANGAASAGGAFIEHALIVLVVPPLIILIGCALHAVMATLPRRARS